MTVPANPDDIGRLLAWACRPKEVPGRHDDYRRLVDRYLNDDQFALLADSVAAGAGLGFIVNERDGVIATAVSDSPLRFTTSDIVKRITDPHRSVIGALILAVARTAYPDAVYLDDPDHMPVFTTQNVIDVLDRAAQHHAEGAHDGDLDESQVEGWRRWLELAEARPNAERRSTKDRAGVTNKVCSFLADAGYLTKRGDTDGGTWVVRPRFRHAVAALTEDSDLYQVVAGLTADAKDSADAEVPA